MTASDFRVLLEKTASVRRRAGRLSALLKCAELSKRADAFGRARYNAMLGSLGDANGTASRLSTVFGYGVRHPVDMVANYGRDVGTGISRIGRKVSTGLASLRDKASAGGEIVGNSVARVAGPRALKPTPGAVNRGIGAKSLSVFKIRPSEALRRANADPELGRMLEARGAARSATFAGRAGHPAANTPNT